MSNKKTYGFKISIDDGFCEHTYTLNLPTSLSISDIAKKICEAYDIQKPQSEVRTIHKVHLKRE